MKRLSSAYLAIIRSSSPRLAAGSELSLSLYLSMVIYRLVCAVERRLVRPLQKRLNRRPGATLEA